MRLTLELLGHTITLALEPAGCDCDTNALDGGTLTSDHIDPGATDHYMGFSNGREDE